MGYESIRYEVKERIATLTLNRPDKLNAFTRPMADEIMTAFDAADQDDAVRAVIVTGAGRGFCAGADLSQGAKTFDYAKRPDREWMEPEAVGKADVWPDQTRDYGGRVTLRIFNSLKPVIGAINGPAVGIGATMLLPMDIRLAAEEARIGFVFSRRGVVMEACSSWFLPRLVGMQLALEWTMTGRVFSAQEALEGRLVKKVVPQADLLPAALTLAREIADNTSAVSVALMRQMQWRLSALDHPMQAHKIDSKLMVQRGRSDDAKEGILSFLEKRPPVYPDKVSTDMPPLFPWYDEPNYS